MNQRSFDEFLRRHQAERRRLVAATPTSDFDRFVEKTTELAGEKKTALSDERKTGRKGKRIEEMGRGLEDNQWSRGMGEWVKRKIGSLGRVITGKTPPTMDPANFGGNYPFITIPDLDGRVFIGHTERTLSERGADLLRSCLVPPGAVMMSCIATVGKCGITTRPSFTNQQINTVVPNADIDFRFLYYAFTQLGQELERAGGGGSVYTNVSKSRFSDIEILVPGSLKEQRAIAHILGTLDDKIELNRRMSQTLEEMARAIFKSWFVDFDPVRAKAAVRREHPKWTDEQVSRAACPKLKPEIAALFPDSFQDSELGEIPKGWRVGKLGDVADVNWGDTDVTKKSYVDQGFVAFSAKGPDGFLPYYDYDRVGVVVSAIGANSGYTWLARGKWSCIKNTIRFWSIDENISTEYLFFATHGDSIWPLRGSAQPFISQTDARNLRILLPAVGTASIFGRIVDPMYAKIETAEIESRTLAALRDALLPKLISGELRVKDAEKFLGKVL